MNKLNILWVFFAIFQCELIFEGISKNNFNFRAFSSKRSITNKLAHAIEKSKHQPGKGPRIQKKRAYKKPTDLEGEEITSNDSSIEENKEKDDFFIESEEGIYRFILNYL